MWWCCGKQQKESLGCKFSRHEAKPDDEEDKEEIATLQFCQCCKQSGHLMPKCPQDPNFKTQHLDIDSEDERLKKLQKFKPLVNPIQTAHFLKKCVIMSSDEEHPQRPFKRGAMQFEDFNYAVFNPHILVQGH